MTTTPIIKISQLHVETEKTMAGSPANTWFAIVNADVMKTKRLSLESLLKYLSEYFEQPVILPYVNFVTEGGIKANNSSSATVNLGDTVVFSDIITYNRASAAYGTANNSYNHANGAFTRANNALAKANSAHNHANGAFDKANSRIELSSNGGISITSNNYINSDIYLGQKISVNASPITISSSDGITLDGGTSKILFLGNGFNIGSNPITINTINGITGGKALKLGESITLNANVVYNHANNAYNYANTCSINPSVNFVTTNTTLYANNRYIVIGDNLQLTVESSPKVNTYIHITNMSSSINNIVKFTGSKIHGITDDIRLDVMNVSVTLCYVGSLPGWVIV